MISAYENLKRELGSIFDFDCEYVKESWIGFSVKLSLWGVLGASVAVCNEIGLFYYGTANKIIGSPENFYLKPIWMMAVVVILSGLLYLVVPSERIARHIILKEISSILTAMISFIWCQSIFFLVTSLYHLRNVKNLSKFGQEFEYSYLHDLVLFVLIMFLLQFAITALLIAHKARRLAFSGPR
ncbi:hypothetical protein C0V97_14085 [Asaia sp. W19]|uniref:hypothetical protein n=1 Tax=unclassified Asaia TaxID=2685023 RepID=UPI000F8F73E2|nr:hypothetical protein [Asaia sp. W19]RUT24854.1 hypothetical protein C0V97_14085 [Asaia sp. W19]